MHADTVGPLPTAAVGGERYFLTVVEDFSNFCSVTPVDAKSRIASELMDTVTLWERQTEKTVQIVRTDRGSEFLNKTFHSFCGEKRIHTELSAVYCNRLWAVPAIVTRD